MKRLILPVIVAVSLAACAHHSDLTKPAAQDDFGVQMAKMNLWREAMFRFQRAVQIAPGDAQAHNNLAVAYEANGDFESARKEYLEALKLDRTNTYIQKNYSRFVEFLSRNRKRQQQDVKTAGPARPTVGGSATAIETGPPERPAATDRPKPVSPPAPPSDLPPPPPTPPPTTSTAPPMPPPATSTAPPPTPPLGDLV